MEKLRDLVEDARDEARWDDLFERKKASLVAAARKARNDIAAGKASDAGSASTEPVNEMRHSPLEDYCTKSSIT